MTNNTKQTATTVAQIPEPVLISILLALAGKDSLADVYADIKAAAAPQAAAI